MSLCLTKLLNSLGSQRHLARRGVIHIVKDDTAICLSEAKPSKRGATGHGAHEVFYMLSVSLLFFRYIFL